MSGNKELIEALNQIEKEKVKEMLGEEGRKQMEQDILIKKALELAAEAAVEK